MYGFYNRGIERQDTVPAQRIMCQSSKSVDGVIRSWFTEEYPLMLFFHSNQVLSWLGGHLE